VFDFERRRMVLQRILTFLVVSVSLFRTETIVHSRREMVRLIPFGTGNAPSMLEAVADLVNGHDHFRLESRPVLSLAWQSS
jgi:hypothetical protein